MTTAVLVRLAEVGDFAAIARLTNHYIRTSAVHFGQQDVSADELSRLWQDHLSLYPWLVAEQDGTFAGYAKAGAWRTRAAYRWTAEIGLYVDAGHHRRGVGRALYSRLLPLLRAQGFRSAIGGITLPNPASVAMHEACGLLPTGVVRAAGFKFGRWHDVGFWQIDLQPDGAPAGEIRSPETAWGESQ